MNSTVKRWSYWISKNGYVYEVREKLETLAICLRISPTGRRLVVLVNYSRFGRDLLEDRDVRSRFKQNK